MGNHDVGIKALEALHKFTTLRGVVAHPLDKEENKVYRSVYDFAKSLGIDVIRGKPSEDSVARFIREREPNLIWVTDYKFLLPEEIIKIPKIGCINLHPSLLPHYRGRAPVNWAIINGERKIGITAHFIDEGVDTGDIIRQIELDISDEDYIGDVLKKLYPLYFEITKSVILDILSGNVSLVKQKHVQTKIYPRRKPEDGLIDWGMPARSIYNLIRAVSRPYPGAFFYSKGQKIIIWRAEVEDLDSNSSYSKFANGDIIDCSEKCLRIKCKDGIIKAIEWEKHEESV